MIQKNKYSEPQLSLNFSIIILDLIYKINLLVDGYYKHKVTDDVDTLYGWLFKHFKTKQPTHICHNGYKLLDFHYDRDQIIELINQGCFDGIDDPRLLTVAGLRRKGLPPVVLREFCQTGNRKTKIGLDQLNYILQSFLPNLPSTRLSVILDPVKIVLTNFRANETEYLISNNYMNEEFYDSRQLVAISNVMYISRSDLRFLQLHTETELNHGIRIVPVSYITNHQNPPLLSGTTPETGTPSLLPETGVPSPTQPNKILEIHAKYTGHNSKKYSTQKQINWISPEIDDHLTEIELNLYSKWYSGEEITAKDFSREFGYLKLTAIITKTPPKLTDPNKIYFIDGLGYFSQDQKTPTKQVYNSVKLLT